MKKFFMFSAAALVVVFSGSCGYNRIQGLDEEVKAGWSEIQNQYQRRYDLIPNLVEVVKGYAKHESETLQAVVNARAKVGEIKLGSDVLNDPQAFKRFQEAQGGLTSSLSKLMVVAENYPDLKSNENFRDLQVQLEGTENRIAVARGRYIEAVKEYNKMVRYFPTSLTAKYLLHMDVKPNFEVENQAVKEVPKVKF
jgi:LemA protein